MHARAERGVAAHWQYKADEHGAHSGDDYAWLSRIVDWQEETSDPDEFMKNLKIDLEQDEVFVFTPKGRVITLPAGATPIDFAYAVHTEVGHACIGAKVNGRLVPLDSQLSSGDTVEIVTSKVEGAGPSRDWLARRGQPTGAQQDPPVVLPRAARGRHRVRAARTWSRRCGGRACRSSPRPSPRSLEEIAGVDELRRPRRAATPPSASTTCRPSRWPAGWRRRLHDATPSREEQLPTAAVHDRRGSGARGRRSKPGVHVEGLDDVMVRLSRCCTPVPGDEIVGFITRGRGVSVHRADCANAVSLVAGQADRLIDVEWDGDQGGSYVASIEIKALDRARLLRDVTAALADHHVNIIASSTRTGRDRVSTMRFDFELADPSHLDSAISTIKSIDSVYDAYRVVPGKGG